VPTPEPSPFRAIPVIDAWDETATLRALKIDLSPHGAEPYRPGQALKLRGGDGKEAFFALSSAPRSDGKADLLIKRGAPAANLLIDAAQRGAAVEATAPIGRGFPVDEAAGCDVLLFAAGSGISPIRSVVQHLVARRASVGRIALYYGQRGPGDFAYAREHDAWRRAGVMVELCASAGGTEPELATGWVQDVAKARSFDGALNPGAVAFLCGMKPMVEAVRATLAEAGLPADRAYLNY
jgi:ferredoxin-NADP reductase